MQEMKEYKIQRLLLRFSAKDDIVLIYTGHSDLYGTDEYYSNQPVIDEELADFS